MTTSVTAIAFGFGVGILFSFAAWRLVLFPRIARALRGAIHEQFAGRSSYLYGQHMVLDRLRREMAEGAEVEDALQRIEVELGEAGAQLRADAAVAEIHRS